MRKLLVLSAPVVAVAFVLSLMAIDHHRNQVVAYQASTTQNPVR